MFNRILACALLLAPTTAFAESVITPDSAPIVSTCDLGFTTPNALDCAGYYSGNLINGSPEDIANQKAAIATLDGDFVWNGIWADVEAYKILTLTNGNQLNFGTSLFGQTIVGAHFGNIAGGVGNASVFWLFDFGTEGANSIILDNPKSFSNAVLYTTGAVPEPATWALMILGFVAVGFAMRRKRRPMLMQIA